MIVAIVVGAMPVCMHRDIDYLLVMLENDSSWILLLLAGSWVVLIPWKKQ